MNKSACLGAQVPQVQGSVLVHRKAHHFAFSEKQPCYLY